MRLEFTIRGRLPGLNEMIAEARKGTFPSVRQKREWTELCAWEARAARLPSLNVPVRIKIRWIEPRSNRDVDNVAAGAKYVLDGLVNAGVLRDDDRTSVVGIIHEFPPPDPHWPRIEVEIDTDVEAGEDRGEAPGNHQPVSPRE